VMGWGLAQVPYVVVPALTLKQAAAPASVLWPVAITLVLGSCLLLPSFWYLYSIFQHKQSH
jgi:cytochrome d ubiquinol oxidase subunit II